MCIFQFAAMIFLRMQIQLFSVSAATPGNSLPSINSREAPPPVEMKVILSARPACLTAVTESPPPMMVVAFGFGQRFGHRFSPGGEFPNLENPGRSIPQNGLGARDLALEKRDRERADVDRLPARPEYCSRGEMRPLCRVAAPGLISSAPSKSIGRSSRTFFCFASSISSRARSSLSAFDPAASHVNALGFEKGVRHRAADQNGVGLFHQRFDHADFVGNLRATEDDQERFGRMRPVLRGDI